MNPDRLELEELLESAQEFGQAASRILVRRANRIAHIHFKGKTDLVTDVDRESEDFLLDHIQKRYPGHNILAEESEIITRDSPFTWVIDPLDGTTNYVHGYPAWAVSLAVTWNHTPV